MEHGDAWWGSHDLAEGQTGRLRVGPLELVVHAERLDWQVSITRDTEPLDERLLTEFPAAPEVDWDHTGAERQRFAFGAQPSQVGIELRLADRPIVIRPRVPLTVPAGERVELFFSTPLWLRLDANPGARELLDVPTLRPKDTWFGTAVDGELCYASLTSGVRLLDEVRMLPYRVVTAATVVNASNTPLALERFSVPVGHLSIYRGDGGHLWTEAVELARSNEDDGARVDLAGAPPAAAGSVELVAPPRVTSTRSFVARTFAGIFA